MTADAWFWMLRWTLLLIGGVYFITEAGILSPFRTSFLKALYDTNQTAGLFFIALWYCPACVGFWVGALLGALHQWPFDHGLASVGESALAAMGVMATWAKLTGPNAAFDVEEPLLFGNDDDGTTQKEAMAPSEDDDDA